MLSRRQEAAGILLSHGVLDAASTALAYFAVGVDGEANPIVRELLDVHVLLGVTVMLAVVGAVAVVYPRLASYAGVPWWFAPVVIGVGLAVAAVNVLVAVIALGGSI